MLNRCHDYEAFRPNMRRKRISIAPPDHEVRDVPYVELSFSRLFPLSSDEPQWKYHFSYGRLPGAADDSPIGYRRAFHVAVDWPRRGIAGHRIGDIRPGSIRDRPLRGGGG